jgi:hypothetical protein
LGGLAERRRIRVACDGLQVPGSFVAQVGHIGEIGLVAERWSFGGLRMSGTSDLALVEDFVDAVGGYGEFE